MTPYPVYYRPAFAYSTVIYPLPRRRALQQRCPGREDVGLTVFRPLDLMNGLGSLFPPVALTAHDREGFSPCTHHSAFWLKPDSTFGLFGLTAFIKSSPGLAIPFDPGSHSASVLAETRLPHGLRANPKVQDALLEGLTRFVTASHFLLGYG